MPLSPTDFANDGDSPLLVAIKAQRWDVASKYLRGRGSSTPQQQQQQQQQLPDDSYDNGLVNDPITDSDSDMVKIPDQYGNLPLHAAIGFKAPDAFLLKLIEAYPDACKVHGSDDWTTLHIGAMYGCSYTVMDALIRANPAALDDDGSGSVETITALHDRGGGSSSGSGSIKRKTPRHYAGKHSPEIQELLLRPTDEWMSILQQQQEN